ncbi:MAG: Hpt domain-containing protein [Desulfovibrionaceae bacterium]|nr:Hpt domain-containing protein [Desulfovibrionaceae bacterium]MBF0513364.1 Hpt domain-containing protein [Desulfovibrionaceae bacterium]
MTQFTIDDETWDAFKGSCERLLPHIEGGLLDIETAKADELTDKLATLMRLVHTLKGDAGIVRLSNMVALCHAMETLLGVISANPALAKPSIVSMLLSALDKLRAMVEDCQEAAAIDIERELFVLDLAAGRFRRE